VSSLQAADVDWSGPERRELLATAEESLTRLTRLVADLLDLSRLRAGVLTGGAEPVWRDDVIPPALDELGTPAGQVPLLLPDDLPPVLADAALLTRVMVNVIGNATRHAPPGNPPTVAASCSGDRVEVRVMDRGTGVSEPDKERIFLPFQRLGDTDNTTGLGLGLALSRGLVEAMEGTIGAEDTPGGGLTMVISLPAAVDLAIGPAEPGRRERKEASP
jgi:two-component system sensor histidine kinase KdpD